MAVIGQQLLTPESGYVRYSLNNDIRFNTNMIKSPDVSSYSKYLYIFENNTYYFRFKFKGTKIRILTARSTPGGDFNIIIDGITETFNTNGSLQYTTLVYDKVLNDSIHTVEIKNPGNTYYAWLDCIDIDSNGYLCHPLLNQVSDPQLAQIGDCIPCRYTALTSGSAGYFSELGTCTANEIPVIGSATPDGLLYLIKVAKGLWIADRVVQHSISWDALNSNKYIEGLVYNSIPKMDNVYTKNGVTVSASSEINTTYIAPRAFNNIEDNVSTPGHSWASSTGTFPQWLKVDYGIQKIIKSYSIKARDFSQGNSGEVPKNFNLEGSNNDIDWTIIDSRINQSWISKEMKSFDTQNNTKYRYYRLYITANNGYAPYTDIDELKMYEGILIRSLSGGNSYIDSNGNSSTTNYSLGAYPSNNEWDTYIVNSDLNGKITKGDNNIWHHTSVFIDSHIKETPILSISANTTRMRRRGLNIVQYVSSGMATTFGFRPVFEIPEANSKQTNLFY